MKPSIIKLRKSDVWTSSVNNLSISPPDSSKPRNLNSFSQYVDEDEGFTEDEIIPERISGTYVYDYNILSIDVILRKKFEQDKKNNLVKLREKLKIENKKVLERQNMIERKISRKKIRECEDEIEKYENDTNSINYEKKSKPLLENYRKLKKISTVVSFIKNSKEELTAPENEEEQKIRHAIIFEYLECARKYITIDLIRELPSSGSCFGCGTKFDSIELIEDESGASICPVCSLETINIVKKPFFSDGSRVNNSRNNYEDRANFEKVLMRYQGKQITKPEKMLYDKLDDYFISKGLPSSKEYRAMKLLPNGTKPGSSKDLMIESLSNIGCSGYYDDINLICNIFFGWPLPDISHLEDDIMRDYDEFQKVYESLDKEGRKSSLNSQWKLYILLKRRGWPCKKRDFKIPTTPHILEYHKTITKQIYKILDWQVNF